MVVKIRGRGTGPLQSNAGTGVLLSCAHPGIGFSESLCHGTPCLVAILSVWSPPAQMFSDNSHCPDCGQQWFPSLELGHWLYQTELVENECYQVFLDRINRADYCPECYPDNPANRSLVLPWSFPLEWAPQNLTRWTFEKACHPFLLGPPLVRKRVHDSRLAGLNPALQLILTRTDKTLNKKLGQSK